MLYILQFNYRFIALMYENTSGSTPIFSLIQTSRIQNRICMLKN